MCVNIYIYIYIYRRLLQRWFSLVPQHWLEQYTEQRQSETTEPGSNPCHCSRLVTLERNVLTGYTCHDCHQLSSSVEQDFDILSLYLHPFLSSVVRLSVMLPSSLGYTANCLIVQAKLTNTSSACNANIVHMMLEN